MFSPRDVSHESYGKPAGLVMSSSGAVARKPRPPQRKHRGARRQVVTSGVKLDQILQESPHVLFDIKQTDSDAKGKSDAVRGAAPVRTPRGPTVPELKLKIHAPVQPSRPPPAAYGRRQRTPRLKPGSASLRPHGLEPSASHTGHAVRPPPAAPPTGREGGVRLETAARQRLEPKLLADTRQQRGVTPRAILVERVRREYSNTDLESLLQYFGVDCRRKHSQLLPGGDEADRADHSDDGTPEDAVSQNLLHLLHRLPLELFDDASYDIHTNQEWAELIPVAARGFKRNHVELHLTSPLDESVLRAARPTGASSARATAAGAGAGAGAGSSSVTFAPVPPASPRPSPRPGTSGSVLAVGEVKGRALRAFTAKPRSSATPSGHGAAAVRAARSRQSAANDDAVAGGYVGEWVPVAVEAFDEDAQKFVVRWQDRPDAADRGRVSRLRICFSKENPTRFAMRVAAAFQARQAALARLQYNLYIDSMPLDGVGEPSEDQTRRITAACMSSPALRSAVAPTTLLYEVKLDWQRAMNRVLFNSMCLKSSAQADGADTAAAKRERLADAAVGKLQVTDHTAFTAVRSCVTTPLIGDSDTPPEKGMVESGAPPFAALSSAFAFNTTLTQPEIVTTLTSIHSECDRVRGLLLLATDFPRGLQLEDFRTEQWKWIGSRCDRLRNDWVLQLAGLIVNGLSGVGKGWFNIYESDAQVFAFSKLHRLLRMVTLVMQDTLRDLVDASLQEFLKLLKLRCSCTVQVHAPSKVDVKWDPKESAKAAVSAPEPASAASPTSVYAASAKEQAERAARRERVRNLLRPPPLFEVELKVPDHKVLLNKEEVWAAHEARKAWKIRRRIARKAAATGDVNSGGQTVPGGAAAGDDGSDDMTVGSEASSLAASRLSVDDERAGEYERGLQAKGSTLDGNGNKDGGDHVRFDDAVSVGSDLTWGTTFTDADGSSDDEMEQMMATGGTASRRGAKADPEPARVAPQYGYAFQFSQSGEDFQDLIQQCITKMIADVSDIKEITPLVMRRMTFTTREFLTSVSPVELMVQDAREQAERFIRRAAKPLEPYLQSLGEYVPLLNLDVAKELDKVREELTTKLDIASLVSRITWHREEAERLCEVLPTHADCGAFRINLVTMRGVLVARHTSMAQGIMDAMAERSAVITETVQTQTQSAKQRLRMRVRTIEELTDLRRFMGALNNLLPQFKSELASAVKTRNALEKFCYRIDKEKKVDLWQALEAQELLMQQMRTVANVLDQRQEAMAEDMLVQQSAFKDQLERLEREIMEFNNLTDLAQLENNYRRLKTLEARLHDAEKEVELYNSREALFGMPITPYKELANAKKHFLPFQLLWSTAHQWSKCYAEFSTTPVMQLDSEDVSKETSEARSNLAQCQRLFFRAQNQRCVQVTQQVKAECDAFAPKVNVITALLTKGMRDRHWQQLSQAVGFKLHPSMAACIPELMERGIGDHTPELTRVARVAAREYELEESLHKMENAWAELRLDIVPYKSTGTFIIKSVGELMALMDEHITTTQGMQFSAYKAPFEEAIDSWTKRLGLASEVLDEWVQVQKAWLYLAPIFDSEDIAAQLPTEAKRFATVDMNWRRTLAAAESATDSMAFLAREKLLQKFKESMRFLNTVQKGLTEYLEAKRKAFPRFYFLSNDDLLQILSQTKEVARVQDHLSKCFEGIHRVQFSKSQPMVAGLSFSNGRSRKSLFRIRTQHHLSVKSSDVTSQSHIIAMQSRQGERIPLQAEVVPGDKGVEVWMREVEESMRLSVKEVIREAMLVYHSAPRRRWLLEWPSQAVLTASQIHWTAAVESALKTGEPDALEDLYEMQLQQLNDMVHMVRGQLSSLSSITVGAMAVIDVHARDVVDRLMKDGVNNPQSFEWIRNLRYYWRDSDVHVEMVTSRRAFGHEYLGNSFRLVVTPLTEKCYMTCMTALDLTLGGAPAGPAGTGKTETVKDLAKALGKQCVVFNCSEGLDYLAMGKFFKGLAFCGAWACFDEFNRIDVEVLSVVAQQIITLQAAVRSGARTVQFEGTEVTVNPAFSVFVTMNPGYAGRTELPGNLKALFRPVAMMVPDYALIGEIMFFAYGFAESRDLARKMVSTFQLCSEQLSSQPHYDYGMRAVKSVIAAAGKLRKQHPDQPERELLYRALQDVNVPKFLAQDLPLFRGIVSDLFPTMAAPENDDHALRKGLRRACEERGLQSNPYFLGKCTQLFHTMHSRHGVMVVGPSGGGKSENIATLASALTSLSQRVEARQDSHFVNVRMVHVAPKAVTMGQLYGAYDDATREWQDGVLAYWVRTFAGVRNHDRKWIVCDGPVDADWIENLNTALDDNKKLCLASGQIIQLPAELNIVFEAENLLQASPATVSRCGMVFHEPQLMGTDPMLASWCDALQQHECLPALCLPAFRKCFDRYLPATLAFLRHRCSCPVPANTCQIVASMTRLLDCALQPFTTRHATEAESAADGIPRLCEGMFVFALVWSAGSVISEGDRAAFSAFLRNEMEHNDHPFPIPSDGLVHDYSFQPDAGGWVTWASLCPAAPAYNSGLDFGEIVVPTPETVLVSSLMAQLLERNMHVMLVGPTGTGKTVNVLRYLSKTAGSEVVPITFTFSARTTAMQLQSYIEERCEKRRRNEYGPPIGNKFVAFLDDLNLPRPEEYGAQPPLELLRQWLTYGGWYNIQSMAVRRIVDTAVVAAMGTPGGGRHAITPRLPRHFNLITCGKFTNDSKRRMFQATLSGFLEVSGFHAAIQSLAEPVTKACVEVYNAVCATMLPTPSKPHYTFNLRDLSKVLAGVLMADKDRIGEDRHRFIRLVVHEARRVLHDRLVDDEDRTWFDTRLATALSTHTGVSWDTFMTVEPAPPSANTYEADLDPGTVRGRTPSDLLLFGDYVGSRAEDRYEEVTDLDGLVPLFEEFLTDYNLESRVPMRLVMFIAAISHVSRLVRVLRQHGNALLLGVGGSGRQSSTKLATFMAEYQLVQISVNKGYSMAEWHEDIKRVLLSCGLDGKPSVLMLVDTQLVHEGMLEDVSNLLNSGDVPGLYSPEEMDQIMEASKFACQLKGLPLTKLNLYNQYITRVRRNLHIVIAMTPVGSTFRDRLRMFPALVNCCTINWYSAWPAEALQWVAESELGLRSDHGGAAMKSPTHGAESKGDDGSHQASDVGTLTCVDVVPERLRKPLVQVFNTVHQSCQRASEMYLESMRRYNYVTPAKYLEFLRVFHKQLIRSHKDVDTKQQRLEMGLQKLEYTSEQVTEMRESLIRLRPELEKTQAEVDEMMVQIHEDRVQADATRAVVAEEEGLAREKAETTRAIADDAQRDLDAVLPLLDKAVECLNALKRADIEEVRSMARPPLGVQITMEAACIMFDVKPAVKRNALGQAETDYWEAAKSKLLRDGRSFLQRMFAYDRDHIPEHTIKAIEEYIDRPEFQPDEVDRVNKASAGVCLWVRAMFQYHQVLLAVEPKKQSLAAAQAELDKTLISLADAKARLRRVTEHVEYLQNRYNDAVRHKESLADEIERCTRRLEAAQKLTAGLGSEAARWRETVAELVASKEHLLGDEVVAAGTIAYLGPFDGDFRANITAVWRQELTRYGITHTPDVTMGTTLFNGPMVREWRLAGLPSDDISTENGIIINRCRQSPIMIDPQLQANNFIKTLGERREAGIDTVKPGEKHLTRTIENAIRYGRWVLIEDVGEDIDPSLVSLLSINTTTMPGASGRFLRVGDAVIPYHPGFRLFLTTSLGNPHFSPEICSNATILNFMLTQSGLEEQLLTTVISREIPALEDRKVQLSIARASMESELLAAETKILSLLNTTTEGHLLDDNDLIQALNRAKGTAHDIKAKIKESAATQEDIERHRDAYRAIASRAAAMFFCIYSLRGVDPMYQFSLSWFKRLFDNAIVNTTRTDNTQARIKVVNDHFTSLVFTEVCRSLFERHKLMFAFMLAVSIQRNAGLVRDDEWRFILSGQPPMSAQRDSVISAPALATSAVASTPKAGTAPSVAAAKVAAGGSSTPRPVRSIATPSSSGPPKPEGTWINTRAWEELARLELVAGFEGLRRHIVSHVDAWASWAALADNELSGGVPAPYAALPRLARLCLIRAIRPDGVVAACQDFVSSLLGEAYLSPPSFNLEASYMSSTPLTPLVFIISPGTDPFQELQAFATNTGMLRSFQTMSLGQGQGELAKQMIATGAARGHWVLLMNCHLYTSWMDTLQSLVEGFRDDNVHRNFRLWLTSEPSPVFPVPVLERSIKMTMEAPTGLRANLAAIYRDFNKEMFFQQPQARTYAKLLYGLAFFHASIVERQRFGALGWNKVYEFSQADLGISREQLDVFLGRYSYVPFKVLNEMTGGINYGGRITDDKDLRTVDVLLRNVFSPKVLEDGYRFSSSGKYVSLPYDEDQPLHEYLRAIEELPVITEPEAFGMHQNANVMVALDRAYTMFDTILSIQPRGAGAPGGGSSYLGRVRAITRTARRLLRQLPTNFDAESISLRYPVQYSNSMNVVLVQEVIRYNGLLSVMRSSLQLLLRATAGEVVMSADLEALGDSLFNQWIPAMWQARGYPSLKPLGAWHRELLRRISFLSHWAANGVPASFWLSGFFFPQAFLTGMLQNFARKYQLPVDTLAFSFRVRDDIDADMSGNEFQLTPPEDGCFIHGLFLEGARWSADDHRLATPEPRELYPAMPVIHLLPVAQWTPAVEGVYRCPVYKTLARQGRLSTTGHSTNFVMWLELPAHGTSIKRPALVSEVGAGISIGDQLADTKELVEGGAAAFCSLRY